MAGLGEACTHVGAILFYLETSTKVNGGHTCTQQKCQWVIPSYQREIPYLPVKDLDNGVVAKPKTSDMQKNFSQLGDCGTKPAILSIVKPYSDSYVPKVTIPSFPKPLQELYNKKYLAFSYMELFHITKCKILLIVKFQQLTLRLTNLAPSQLAGGVNMKEKLVTSINNKWSRIIINFLSMIVVYF